MWGKIRDRNMRRSWKQGYSNVWFPGLCCSLCQLQTAVETATKAHQLVNGYVMRGKPVIIAYGHADSISGHADSSSRQGDSSSRHPDSSSWQNCHSTQSLPVYIPCPVFSISWSGLIRHLSALVSFPSYIFRWKVIWVRDYMLISFQLQAASYTSRAEWWLCCIPMS